MDINKLTDPELAQLIESRWDSADPIWKIVNRVYRRNVQYYDMESDDKERIPDYIKKIPAKQQKVRSNRIFTNVEAVINSIIANPPKPNLIPGRSTPESIELAQLQEQYFINRYNELNVKETLRKALRNLYFGRLLVLKPFWNAKINDFDVISLDPRKIRVAKNATKEVESEFVIEEVEDNIEAVMLRFPKKAKEIQQQSGFSDTEILIQNPTIKYKEAWIKDRVIFKYMNVILGNIRNPYWDWDGLLVTSEEQVQLDELSGQDRRAALDQVRSMQPERQQAMAAMQPTGDDVEPVDPSMAQPDQQPINVQPDAMEQPLQANAAPNLDPMQQAFAQAQNPMQPEPGEATEPQTINQTQPQTYAAYRFNHFDVPRKPYIFATVLNNENTPIGRTDFISQAAPLQESVDRRKRQLDENAELMNGIIKVDSSVMSKEDAQKLRYEVSGIIWGKNVAAGVSREAGTALPEFIYQDMEDSRNEIDNIMAATSAFRGEREGQETKAGRLALIEQSFLRLNELVQVVDFATQELFNWFYQLAKVRYTETHYAKSLGDDNAVKIMELVQDDFEKGSEVRVIPGKTLPEDKQYQYQRAQEDVSKGIISPIDYMKVAGYTNPLEMAKNAEVYKLNPAVAVGLTPEELQQLAPPQQAPVDLPKESINYKDLPPDGQVQLAAKAGIQLDPNALQQQQDQENQAQANAKQADSNKAQQNNNP